MSDAQLGEFRSRMERIQKDRPDPARVLRRDSYGLIVETRKTKKSFKLISGNCPGTPE